MTKTNASLFLAVCLALLVVACGNEFWKNLLFQAGKVAYDRGDYDTALKKFRPLAEQGHAEAQFHLGLMYAGGQGVPQDLGEAARWYQHSAEQGFGKAQYNLGLMYTWGRGVPQDYTEAMKWYRLAADQGDEKAQNNLGYMYYRGQEVPRNYVRAYMWASLAAAQGNVDGTKGLETLEKEMTHAQIAEAQRLAREWKAIGK